MLNPVTEWLDFAVGQARTPELLFTPPLGIDPSAPGTNYISVTPSGSTPVPGFENGYRVSIKSGQPIEPTTGGAETRVQMHVLLISNGVPPTR